jgi:hypothetical protein
MLDEVCGPVWAALTAACALVCLADLGDAV